MKINLAKFFLGLSALLYMYLGLVFLIDPIPMLTRLSVAPTGPAGLVELRTFYGGFLFSNGAEVELTDVHISGCTAISDTASVSFAPHSAVLDTHARHRRTRHARENSAALQPPPLALARRCGARS